MCAIDEITILLIAIRNEDNHKTKQSRSFPIVREDTHTLPGVLPRSLLQDKSPIVVKLSIVW
jgi:hypothetical protein